MFAVHDPGLARFVVREKGAAFLLPFTAVNFLVQLALPAGAAVSLGTLVRRSAARRARPSATVVRDERRV
jgi:hypothetical protein